MPAHSLPCLEGRKINDWIEEKEGQGRVGILYPDLCAVYDPIMWAR